MAKDKEKDKHESSPAGGEKGKKDKGKGKPEAAEGKSEGRPEKAAKGEKPEGGDKGEKGRKGDTAAAAPAEGAPEAAKEPKKKKEKAPKPEGAAEGPKKVYRRVVHAPSKRFEADRKMIEQAASAGGLSVKAAVKLLKQTKPTKFDQTVECVVTLGIDPKQADQLVRGSLSLPHGIGKSKKVVVFCPEDQAEKAKAAGAIDAGLEALVKRVSEGWSDFDVAIATPDVMPKIARLGRVLGPQGKMPNPKSGTVSPDVAQAVKEHSAGKIQFRNDAGGNVHAVVGKLSFDEGRLADNVNAFLAHIRRVKPVTAKGLYLKKASLSATMSPGIPLNVGTAGDEQAA
jgi:large subunit ribosomal protein L1